MEYQNISVMVAFLGGALVLLPACGPALLPAFFAYTFKRKQDLVKGAIYFGFGFALLFFPFSLGLNLLVDLLIGSRTILFSLVGYILIFFGALALVSFQLPLYSTWVPKVEKPWDALFLGLVFGLTSSACVAPIYGAILSISTVSSVQQIILLLVFISGMIAPLILWAYFLERLNILKKIARFSNLISGIGFIILGLFFIGSNGVFLRTNQGWIIPTFDSLNLALLEFNINYPYLDFIVLIALILSAIFIGLKKR